MSNKPFDSSRRRFFGQVAIAGLGAAAGMSLAEVASAQAPELEESDPTGAALGYRKNTADVDAAKYPNHKADQNCANCNLIQGKDGDELRPCAIFPGKLVRADGWCAAWVKKA